MQERELPSQPDSILSPSQEDFEMESPPPPPATPSPALHHDTRQFSGEAVVDEEIRPTQRGRVYFRSSWWFARCDRDLVLPAGERVEVLGLETEGMTLLVAPYGETPREPQVVPGEVPEADSILTPQPEPD